ncbi:ubiquinol-cytochrome C chaperone [Hansschlegelia quercus]|uniref:Ubiquinol-cytochrome C chaperone n=2 Tax=Hansschlegelia quercus TaxID=2528245 RepID=A0A4Q9GR83_9HYPH|nr:ubiquinol-cytochrome C chaperone [Hansschlegelia quercus]
MRAPVAPTTAEVIHAGLVAASRRPELYDALDAPDTLPGRFEVLVLHVALYLRRLKGRGPRAEAVAQEVVDVLFKALDAQLREIGIGDMSVPKKMKTMASSFYDGAQQYDAALTAGDLEAMSAALARIVYRAGPDERSKALTAYVFEAAAALDLQDIDRLVARGPVFPAVGAAS